MLYSSLYPFDKMLKERIEAKLIVGHTLFAEKQRTTAPPIPHPIPLADLHPCGCAGRSPCSFAFTAYLFIGYVLQFVRSFIQQIFGGFLAVFRLFFNEVFRFFHKIGAFAFQFVA